MPRLKEFGFTLSSCPDLTGCTKDATTFFLAEAFYSTIENEHVSSIRVEDAKTFADNVSADLNTHFCIH